MRAHEFLNEALKPQALAALQQARGAIAQQRDADVAAWQQDFEKNMGQRFMQAKAGRPNPVPPATTDYSKYSYQQLKPKLAGVNTAIEKMQQLEKLQAKAERLGLMNPGLQADTDLGLYMRGADQDDYATLIQKADVAIQRLQQRLNINRAAYK